MLNLNPITLVLAKRKGVATRDAVLFSAAIPAARMTSLGTVGQVVLADRITDRIVVRQDIPVQPPRLNIAPVPGLGIRPIAPSLPFPFPVTRPAPGTPPAPPAPRFIQKIEQATVVNLATDPPEIEGAAGLKIDFASPIDADSYNWDFGDSSIRSSTAKNPTTKIYNNSGDFDVTLTTTDSGGTETETVVAKVKVS